MDDLFNIGESGIELDFAAFEPAIEEILSQEFKNSPPELEAVNFYQINSRPAPVQSPSFKTESFNSRTNLKQQLMKDQLMKERERKRAEGKEAATPVTPVKVPINVQNVALPQHVLQISTKLENPTKYHIREKQKQNVLKFLSKSIKTEGNQTTSAPTTLQMTSRTPYSYPPVPSPSMQSVASGGASDADDVIETILSYEDTYADSGTRSFAGSTTSIDSGQHRGVKSESYGFEDLNDRRKKDTHNMIERKRRYNINDRIKELGDLLPHKNEDHYDIVRDTRGSSCANKGNILKSSVEYIKILKNEMVKMRQVEVDYRQMQMENRKLLLRIKQLENQAQAKGVALVERTWKPAEPQEIIEKYIIGRTKTQMPDVVSEAAILYDDSMDDVQSPDPMLGAAASLPVFIKKIPPDSPMDTDPDNTPM